MTTFTGLTPVFPPPGYTDWDLRDFGCRDHYGSRLNLSTLLGV